MAEAKKKNFDIDKCVNDSLQKGYAAKLVEGELSELITPKRSLRPEPPRFTQLRTRPSATDLPQPRSEKSFWPYFLTTPTLRVQAKMDEAYKKGLGDLFAVNELSNINAIIDKFVAENYSK